jgi:hypothetical protein
LKILSTVLTLFVALCCFGDTNLDDVINLYTKGSGGQKAIENVRSVEISLTITEPKFTVDAIYRADRKIRMRIDILSEGKRVFTEAFDGKNGWQMGEDGKPKDASVEGSTALRNGILLPGKLFGLHELPALGQKLSYEGRESIDNISYQVLKVTLDSGFQKYLYVHPDTGRIERTREYRALHVDMDPTKQIMESRSSDFRIVNGVLFAFHSEERDLEKQQVLQTTVIKEIKVNPVLDEALFNRP